MFIFTIWQIIIAIQIVLDTWVTNSIICQTKQKRKFFVKKCQTYISSNKIFRLNPGAISQIKRNNIRKGDNKKEKGASLISY